MALPVVTTYPHPRPETIKARLAGTARASRVTCKHCGRKSPTPVWETDRPNEWYNREVCGRSSCLKAEETILSNRPFEPVKLYTHKEKEAVLRAADERYQRALLERYLAPVHRIRTAHAA